MRLSVFFFFLALFFVTTAGHIYTIDSYLNYAVTKSVGSHGTLEIPRFMMTVEGREGRHYSKLGIGQSLVSLPLYWTGCLVEIASPRSPMFMAYSREFKIPHNGDVISASPQTLIRVSSTDGARVFFTTLTNAFVAAGLCVVFMVLLRGFGVSAARALGGTAILAFATPLWVYSRDLFAEPLFGFCLIGTLYLLRDPDEADARHRIMLAGILSSLGILARISFVPIVAIFATYLIFASHERRAGLRRGLWYCLCCVPVVVVIASLNLKRFGGVALTGYHTAFDQGFSLPLGTGLVRNLVSPYRSILLYAPPVALFILGFAGFGRRYRRQLLLMTSVVVYVFVIYSKWWAWHGGWCWGPRFLVPILPLLLLPGLAVIEDRRRWLLPVTVVLALIGVIVQVGGVLINYTAAYDYWIKIGKLDWAEANIQTFSPITTHLKAMLVTDPSHYDLWIIQAWQVAGPHFLWVLVGLGALILFSGASILRYLLTQRQPVSD